MLGSHALQFLSSITAPPPSSPIFPLPQNPRFSNTTTSRLSSTRYGGRSGGSNWDSNAEETILTERFRFNLEDEFLPDDDDEDDKDKAFGFRSSEKKKRIWWSDDQFDDEEEEEEFGIWEGIFKVFKAFGWMLPAIIISMLLGTGPNAFFMALALPLAQSALSLATDTFWVRSSDNPRPKPRTKKRPSAGAASNIGMRKEKEQNTQKNKRRGNHKSGEAANEASVKNGGRSMPNFGGWDELDKRGRTVKVPMVTPAQKENEPRQQRKGKLSRRVRNREKPLLLRLLISIFPFLGSWTKLI